ncbi:MAG TPA: D-2-hydroxyacid dehydrogenase [Thermoproteales archaeon]|nr:D-2-hydroxyacid dehydrogenase [Thermoproteales archaeon]
MKVALTWNPKPEELKVFLESLKYSVKVVHPLSRKERFKELEKLVSDVEVIVGGYVPDSVILKAEKLKLIQTLTVGVERFNFELLKSRGIMLATASGTNAKAVAEMAFGFILAFAKRIIEYDSIMKSGKWVPYTFETTTLELSDKVLGIIGFGNIGREVAKLGKAFGMKVIAIKREPVKYLKEDYELDFLGGPHDIEKILRESDFLIIAVPLTRETRGMIGEKELRLMKPTAFLINVSRGPVVDEEALYKALKKGWIAGAGLDVWWYYPPNPDAPSKKKIHLLPNVIATPHKAGWTIESRFRALKLAAENINNLIEGKPLLNLVDLDKGY